MWRCFYCASLNAESSFECRCSAPRRSAREVLDDEIQPVIHHTPYFTKAAIRLPAYYYVEPDDSPDYYGEHTTVDNTKVVNFKSPLGRLWDRIRKA
jgi:hypothetical protein